MSVTAALLLALVALAVPGAAQAQAQAQEPEGTPPGMAWVRIAHFVPDLGTVSIELQPAETSADAIAMGEADYAEVSPYDQLEPGTYRATVRETDGAADALLSRSFDVAAGEARTVAVVGTADQARLALLEDDLTSPAPGTARVRLLSASENASPVTVRAVDGPTVAEGAVLGQATPYATVPEGSWDLEVDGATVGAAPEEVALVSGSIYTVVVRDAANGSTELELVTDAAGTVIAPLGGAATGGGGTAAGEPGVAGAGFVAGIGLLLVGLLTVGAAVLTRRRPARPVT